MLKIKGHVKCVLRDKHGNIVQIENDKNTPTSDLKVDGNSNVKKSNSPTNQETDKLNPNH